MRSFGDGGVLNPTSKSCQSVFHPNATTGGASKYEDALLLQARLEAPEATEEARLALVRRKCQLVVACQKYGDQKKGGDAKADDVETLLARFPCLRVAYLEVVKDRRAAPNGTEEAAEVIFLEMILVEEMLLMLEMMIQEELT